MKQGNASGATIDLDDLDRQLRQAASAPRRSGSDDPLAELARIVGQDDPFGGSAQRKPVIDRAAPESKYPPERQPPSFDDFLKIPPRSALGAMPTHTPPIAPLFPEYAVPYAPAVSAPAVPAPAQPAIDRLPMLTETVPAEMPHHSLGLRPVLDDQADVPVITATVEPLRSTEAGLNDLEARLANAVRDDAMVAAVHEPIGLPEAVGVKAEQRPENFDDMLAEFEAAMRDAGGEKLPPIPSLEPQMVPPPPPEMVAVRDESTGMGMAAAGAAAVATGAVASAASARNALPRPKRGLLVAGGVIAVALLGVGSLMVFGTGSKSGSSKDAPVIAAKPGVTKERPANPGGVEVPNQDKEILQPATAPTRQVERVAPREEQPVDLTQAQRTAQTEGAGAVRQIPGVSIIAPVSTTPPAATPPGQPVARPVASVPISITGQPPAATTPVAPAPVAPAPVAPAPAPVVAAAPAPVPVTTPTTPAEPRRVRTVPIRPDESAPARAQAQPRVVPANPRPAPVASAPEPEDANAPLRITPQANRTPQRVASTAPGIVPPSTPTTASTAPEPTASVSSGASGFTVQLAAEGSEDAARSKFNRVRGQHTGVLGSMSPNIRSAEVNGRSVYRVRVGNMSREEAVSLCERLKSDGGSCFVARN